MRSGVSKRGSNRDLAEEQAADRTGRTSRTEYYIGEWATSILTTCRTCFGAVIS